MSSDWTIQSHKKPKYSRARATPPPSTSAAASGRPKPHDQQSGAHPGPSIIPYGYSGAMATSSIGSSCLTVSSSGSSPRKNTARSTAQTRQSRPAKKAPKKIRSELPNACRIYNVSVRLPSAKESHNFVACLADQTGTEIRIIDGRGRSNTTVKIWGTVSACEDALFLIDNWVIDNTGQKELGLFSKVSSMTEDKRIIQEYDLDRSEDTAYYREVPDSYETCSIFKWPLVACRPEDVLGPQCEQLDQIRLDHKCAVVLRRWGSSTVFEVFGKALAVEQVLERLAQVTRVIEARNQVAVHLNIVLWPGGWIAASHIGLFRMQTAGPLRDLVLIAAPDQSDGGTGGKDKGHQAKLSAIHNHVDCALQNAVCFKGRLDFRIRLGPLVLDRYRKTPIMTVQEFVEMTEEPSFEAHVHEGLGDATQQDILANIQGADELFERPSLAAKSLREARPVFITQITLDDEMGGLELEGVFRKADEEKEFDILSTDLYRSGPAELLELRLLEVCSGLAWALELRGERCVHERHVKEAVKGYMACFFKIKAGIDPLTALDEPWIALTGLGRVRNLRQEIRWSYRVRDSGYQVRFAKTQEFGFAAGGRVGRVMPVRTSVCVTKPDWEAAFAGNKYLDLGERADWGRRLEELFPVTEGTVEELIGLLYKIQEVALAV